MYCNNYFVEIYRKREHFGEGSWHRVAVISSSLIKVTVGKSFLCGAYPSQFIVRFLFLIRITSIQLYYERTLLSLNLSNVSLHFHLEREYWELCNKCNMMRPKRSHHCSRCGHCVRRMDHHCPW